MAPPWRRASGRLRSCWRCCPRWTRPNGRSSLGRWPASDAASSSPPSGWFAERVIPVVGWPTPWRSSALRPVAPSPLRELPPELQKTLDVFLTNTATPAQLKEAAETTAEALKACLTAGGLEQPSDDDSVDDPEAFAIKAKYESAKVDYEAAMKSASMDGKKRKFVHPPNTIPTVRTSVETPTAAVRYRHLTARASTGS